MLILVGVQYWDVDGFSMTAAVWAPGWTEADPPNRVYGEIPTDPTHPYRRALNGARPAASNHTQRGKTTHGGFSLGPPSLSPSSIYFHYNYAVVGLGFSYERAPNSMLEKGYASLLLRYYSYYDTAASAGVWRAAALTTSAVFLWKFVTSSTDPHKYIYFMKWWSM